MDRLMEVALLLCAVACCALAQNGTNSTASTPLPTPTPTPSASPLPSPTPIVSRAHWSFSNGSAICVAMDAKIIIHITYLDTSGLSTTLIETVDNSSHVDDSLSYCNHPGCQRHINTTLLTLAWDNNTFNFGLMFEKNITGKNWGLGHLNLTFSTENFTSYNNSSEFPSVQATYDPYLFKGVLLSHSYQCNHSATYTLDTETKGTVNVTVTISDLHSQAFSFNNTVGDYGDAFICVQDRPGPSKVAPIVVGVVLGVLAVVVLVGYITGRVWSWSQQRKAKYEMLS